MRRLLSVLVLGVAGVAFTAGAATILVPYDQPTIQAAIDAAVSGDTVLVADGMYPENLNIAKSLVIESVGGSTVTSITRLSHGIPIVLCDQSATSSVTLSGFTVEGDYSEDNGYGIMMTGSGPCVVSNCDISGCWGTGLYGGGVYCAGSSATITRCAIHNNFGEHGAAIAIFQAANVIIDSCVMYDNSATGTSGAIYANVAADLTVSRSVCYDNTASSHSGFAYLHEVSQILIENNTVVSNTGNTARGCLCIWNTSHVDLLNNIIAFNDGGYAVYVNDGTDLLADYNNEYGNAIGGYYGISPGEGSISFDPLFCDTIASDFRLDEASPCVGAGLDGANIGALGIGCPEYSGPVWHVAEDGSDVTGDGRELNPFATIQRGIDAANEGDTVLIDEGTYNGEGNHRIHADGKPIVIMGVDRDNVVIDGEGLFDGFSFVDSGEDTTTVISSLTVRDCLNGVYLSPHERSQSSSPLLLDVRLTNNNVGIYAESVSQPHLRHSVVDSNATGINSDYSSVVRVVDCAFDYNDVGLDPRHSWSSGVIIADSCVFTRNQLVGWCIHLTNSSVLSGIDGLSGSDNGSFSADSCLFTGLTGTVFELGGLDGTSCHISNCSIIDNPGSVGAGWKHLMIMENCIITGNGGRLESCLDLDHCLYAFNAEGILVSAPNAFFKCTNSTIAFNNDTAIQIQGYSCDAQIETSIIAFNSGPVLWFFPEFESYSVSIACNDFFANGGGTWVNLPDSSELEDNIFVDPMFCDTAAGNYSLHITSPCSPDSLPCGQIGAFGIGCDNYLGRVWHISVSGDDVTGDGSADTPYATIQHGVDMAYEGDTVLVHDGTYTGQGNRDIDFGSKNLALVSENGSESTVIDCDGTAADPHRALYFFVDPNENGGQVEERGSVHGFTIQNGRMTQGGAIWMCWAAVRFENCLFTNDSADYGGVVWASGATPTFSQCEFAENMGRNGATMYGHNGSYMCVDSCVFTNNTAFDDGGAVACHGAQGVNITSCTFAGNTAEVGGAVKLTYSGPDSISVIHNCTFVDNEATYEGVALGAALSLNDSSPLVSNCIIALNQGGASVYVLDASPVFSCTDIWGNVGGDWVPQIADQFGLNGNISVDPQFCNVVDADYSLQSTSPCHPDSSDCGLYGAQGVGCLGDLITGFSIQDETSLANVITHTPVFAWQYEPQDGFSQSAFQIAVGTDEDWATAEMWEPETFVTGDTFVTYAGDPLLDGETYYLRLRLSYGIEWTAWHNTSFRMNSVPSVPLPLRPINDTVVGQHPTLWAQNSVDAEDDPLAYDFWVVVDTTYGEPDPQEEYDVSEASDSTGWQVPEPLHENWRYWWKVRAFDGFEYSDWTDLFVSAFFVDETPEAPSPPTPTWPPDTSGLPVWDMLPTFVWGRSFDYDPFDSVLYRLELAMDPDFAFVNTTDSIATTEYTLVDSLDFDTPYWWRVSAFDIAGHTTMSEYYRQFWTWTLGDMDHNHQVDIADLVFLVTYMFQDGPSPQPLIVADINGDCLGPDIADLVHLVTYMFQDGPPPGVGCTDALAPQGGGRSQRAAE